AGSSGEAGGVGEARVAVYDALGREVAVLHEGPSAGAVTVSVDAGQLAPGAYVIRAEAGAVVRTQALTIVR
ncbi:MAG: T9SS type A sorting domain-containing protein, partial [Bacteroidota bacterium]